MYVRLRIGLFMFLFADFSTNFEGSKMPEWNYFQLVIIKDCVLFKIHWDLVLKR